MNYTLALIWVVIGVGLTATGHPPVEALLAFLISTVWILIDSVEKRP